MTIFLSDCARYMEYRLGYQSMPAELPAQEVINQCGEFICSYPWKWLERGFFRSSLRGTINLVGATWTEATLTLTLTGAFATYAFLTGDQIEITAGTNATPDFYVVASKTSADAIVLERSIGATADGQTDIAATFELAACALPGNLQRIISYTTRGTLTQGIAFTTMQDLLLARVNAIGVSGIPYYCAISHAVPAGGGTPVPRLELDKSPPQNETAAVVWFYREGWRRVTKDADPLSIPTYFEGFFLDVLREYVAGLTGMGGVWRQQRMEAITQAAEWRAMVARDGLIQPNYGPLQGGRLAQVSGWGAGRYLADEPNPVPTGP